MNKKNINVLITIVSIVIPVVVAVLFRVKVDGYDFSFLPPFMPALMELQLFYCY